ncbi:ClpP [Corchorus olitorius]|uniref:ATP-dependent Clp protease proteolytic subunit n=1 Tax=Corchorus olitorius TaxID=93759 RepID=A0A1R3G2Q3_9ROSI|nr:ClpP [Corchorus olitorius]
MDLLFSSPLTSSLSSLQLKPKPIPSFTLPNPKPSFLCFTANSVSSSLKVKTTPNCLRLSAPQSPASAMRGAETDAMGLLLRERIVFLGNSIDDFVADAIISQLLLLDAQDPNKDIRLFINSPGGSLSFCILKTLMSQKKMWSTKYLLLGGKPWDEQFPFSFGPLDDITCACHIQIDLRNLDMRNWFFSLKTVPYELVEFCATMGIYDVVQLVRADVSTIALGISASTASIILGGGTKGKRFAMPNARIMIHQPLGGASGQVLDVEIQADEIMDNKNNVIRIISDFTGRSFEQVEKDIDRDRYMSPMEAVEYGMIDAVIDKDSIIPLQPVPERVKPTLSFDKMIEDPMKFLTPDVPDDEIY